MQVKQKEEYFGLPHNSANLSKEAEELLKTNNDKMRRKITSFGKQYREYPNFTLSFLTRAKAMETCFGNVDNEEANIAASILRSIKALGPDIRILVA